MTLSSAVSPIPITRPAYLYGSHGRRFVGFFFSSVILLAAAARAQGPPPIVWSGGGHIGIRSVATSPDGRVLATGSFTDETVKLWDIASGRLRHTLAAHIGGVQAVAMSRDGRWVASCGEYVYGGNSSSTKLWNAATGAFVRDFDPSGQCFGVDVSPDGNLVAATNSWDVLLFRTSDGALVRRLSGHQGLVFGVRFSPDGQTLASTSADKTIILWHVSDGLPLHTLIGHSGFVDDVDFHPNGLLLASAS